MLSITGDTTTWLRLHGCDVRALCDVTGISEVMLFPRAPGRFPRGSGDFRGAIQPQCQGGPRRESRTLWRKIMAARQTPVWKFGNED